MSEKLVQEATSVLAALQQQRSDILTRIGTTSRDIETVDSEITGLEPVRQTALIDGDTSALNRIKKQRAGFHERRDELRDLKSALENRAAKLDLEITAAKKNLADAARNLAREQLEKATEKYHAHLPGLVDCMTEIVNLIPKAAQGFQRYEQLIYCLPRELFRYAGETPKQTVVWNRDTAVADSLKGL